MRTYRDDDGIADDKPPPIKRVKRTKTILVKKVKKSKLKTKVLNFVKRDEFWLILVGILLALLIIGKALSQKEQKPIQLIPSKLICDLTKPQPITLEPLKQFPQGQRLPEPVLEPISEERPDIAIETYTGEASHYTVASSSDRTASGETLVDEALTCALPPEIGQGRFGMRVRVTNLTNGLSVVVKYNDSGPFCGERIIDLTSGAQQAIEMDGISQVKIELLHTEMSQGSNNFAYGYCTDYVASMVPVAWNGNAKEWYWQAIVAGYKTGNVPSVGAILCTSESSWGHVAYVEVVHLDGTIIVSEQNYAGWNVISTRQIASNYGRYIY